jgi:hypothetical protein
MSEIGNEEADLVLVLTAAQQRRCSSTKPTRGMPFPNTQHRPPPFPFPDL